MKLNRTISLIAAAIPLILALLPSARAQEIADKALQAEVDHYTNTTLKIRFLSSVLGGVGAGSRQTNNLRISSAITLLGKIGGTNVIEILITNLTFIDHRYNGSPASRALIVIGEPAVPKLLGVLTESSLDLPQETSEDMLAKLQHGYKESPEESRVRWAALTIGLIESRHWKEFEDREKPKLPKKVWNMLVKYAVVVSR